MIKHKSKIGLLSLIALELMLVLYMVSLNSKVSFFVEIWPLENILIETIILIMVVVTAAWLIFQKVIPSLILANMIMIFLLVIVPVAKYPNDKLLYGPWDSTAFYSFGKWIVERGYVASNNELYYSNQYGSHPGIGMIPAVVYMITGLSLPLTASMYLVLVTVYLVYFLFFLCSLKAICFVNASDYHTYLLILSLTTLLMFFSPYYGGVEIGYTYVGLLLYVMISLLVGRKGESSARMFVVACDLGYAGLLLTHYSTAIIITFYLIMVIIALVGLYKFSNALQIKKFTLMVLLFIVMFFSYEFYADVYLASSTIRYGFQALFSLYVRELESASRALELHATLTLLDLLKYLISNYIKSIIILISILIYVLLVVFKLRFAGKNYKLLVLLIFSSLFTWIVGWAGVGSFMSGGRALPVIQFVYVLNIVYVLDTIVCLPKPKSGRGLKKFLAEIIAYILIITGFILNFGLPVGPLIQSTEGNIYTYLTWTQGGITQWSLHPIEYANNFLEESGPSFLCLQPYTGFGLCDLLWNKPKIPNHGSISLSSFMTSEEIIKLLSNYNNVIIPIPSRDDVLPGPRGYTSFYLKPYNYSINYCRGKIYTNGVYHLFIS